MQISATFDGTDAQVEKQLIESGPAAVGRIINTGNAQLLRLQQRIVLDKLQGQVLHHRTGKLGASIRMEPMKAEGTQLVGAVTGGGGPAWYGRLHEYGGTFQAQRHSVAHFGKGITGIGHVGKKIRALEQRRTATVYTIHFPERSFMRSSLEELRGSIQAEMAGALGHV